MGTALKHHKHLHNPLSPTCHESLANVDNNGEDRINNLPESILCHILSKLPTKFAAGTTILSTKWNNIFASIPNPTIDIDDSLLLNPHNNATNSNFINFVNHLFTVTLIDVPTIHKLHHQCHHNYGYSNIDEWFFLPKLKRLYLDYIGFVDGESFERVVDECLVLEELPLDGVEFEDIELLRISSNGGKDEPDNGGEEIGKGEFGVGGVFFTASDHFEIGGDGRRERKIAEKEDDGEEDCRGRSTVRTIEEDNRGRSTIQLT
ncbi:F-box/LRR-repeat protein [Camellia lanceoleosa]|uniref:F-box/LRR-repeat protein n=1 Tax=Camellia lanceoleosa TaxID=1840588 RepID=A0ACC0HD80_9ERIC|nr:F-box/LRR-repeat protein [Camellia lanceoleosa]